MFYRISIPVLLLFSFVFTSCGKEKHEASYESWMTKTQNGEVKVFSEAEKDRYCEESFCEPNFTVQAFFGKKRKKPEEFPRPAPPAQDPPRRPPPANSDDVNLPQGQDSVDYSANLLGLSEAWKTTKGSSDVVVAVIDTGVDLTHPDLKNNIYVNLAEKNGKAGVDDDGNGYIDDVYGYDFYNNRGNGQDDNDHGTHCAGIIAAAKDGQGTVGIAPGVRILPLKFLDRFGFGSTSDAIRAIDYAVKMGAKILSLSWGGPGRSELLDQAIQSAISKGVLVVAAAGNGDEYGRGINNDDLPSYPSNYGGVISVASSNSGDQLAAYSNYGVNTVMIAAPGHEILSTVVGGKFAFLSGTSMATPKVSGALALALSVSPSSEPELIKRALCDSSKSILTSKVSCGRLQLDDFVKRF